MEPSVLYCVIVILFLPWIEGAKLSNSKLVPADGMLCGSSKMGFKLSKSELIERFKSLSEQTKDPVEMIQVYVSGTKTEAICLFDPLMVEDKRLINATVAEFEDGEKGVNVTASPEIISLGNWLPYFAKDKTDPCVTSVKADIIMFFQANVIVEAIAPLSLSGAKLKLTIHCEMPGPRVIDTNLMVHRVDHIGSAVGEIPFTESIQMKFVHPSDPSNAISEVNLDEPVRLVIWKVRQGDRTGLRTSIMPMQCELYSEKTKGSGIVFVQNSCQARTPADIVTSVTSKRTDVEGLEFREVYWADFKAFRFDGGSSLLASCTVRVCAKSHLSDCHNKNGPNGQPCFNEAGTPDMSDYPSITGDNVEDGKPPEQPNQELELLRFAYPKKFLPVYPQRYKRGMENAQEEFITINQRLYVAPNAPSSAEAQQRTAGIAAYATGAAEAGNPLPGQKAEICMQSMTFYVMSAVGSSLLLLSGVIIAVLIHHLRQQRRKRFSDTVSLSSGACSQTQSAPSTNYAGRLSSYPFQ